MNIISLYIIFFMERCYKYRFRGYCWKKFNLNYLFVFFATVFLKIWYWLFRFWRTCIQNFVRCKNMYSKYMYMTALLSQIIRTCGNTNLEIFFAEKIYNVAVIPIISYIFNLFYLIYFVLKGLFFLFFYFSWYVD